MEMNIKWNKKTLGEVKNKKNAHYKTFVYLSHVRTIRCTYVQSDREIHVFRKLSKTIRINLPAFGYIFINKPNRYNIIIV